MTMEDFYKRPEDGACLPVARVTRHPDGSYDVRRAVETMSGKVIHLIADDRYETAADLPVWIPAEMR